jgi:hypothetical protein
LKDRRILCCAPTVCAFEDAMKKPDTEDEARWARLREPRRWSVDDAKWVLDAQSQSGKSMGEFAEQRGLHKKRLYSWRERLKRQAAAQTEPAQSAPLALLPVTVGPTALTRGECAVVVSASGVRIEVRELSRASRNWVAELLGLGSAS